MALLGRAELGERIKHLREAQGMRQEDLAERARKSGAYISRIEMGLVSNPKIDDLQDISEALGTPFELLVAQSDEEQDDGINDEMQKKIKASPDLKDAIERIVRAWEVSPRPYRGVMLRVFDGLTQEYEEKQAKTPKKVVPGSQPRYNAKYNNCQVIANT